MRSIETHFLSYKPEIRGRRIIQYASGADNATAAAGDAGSVAAAA